MKKLKETAIMKFDPHFSEDNSIDKRQNAKKRFKISLLSVLIALGAFMGVSVYQGRSDLVPLFLKKAKVSDVVSTGVAQVGGPFTLVDENGKTVTEAMLKDKFSFVFFGFVGCPDVCPVGLSKMAAVYSDLPESVQKQTQMIFITVDPARDTVEVVKEFTDMFHDNMIGLTGSEEQISAAAKAYLAYYAKRENKEAPEYYMMDHSSYIYLMDKNGQYLRHFGHSLSVDDIISGSKKHIFASN